MDAPIYHLEHVVKAKEEQMEDFVGPLDLILHLLHKNKMEIKDIQIALILEQYLQWMERRNQLDLDVASEFVTMASHLILIKSKMLLSVYDEEVMSEMEQLIAALEAHQRNEIYGKIKSITEAFEQRFEYGADQYPHEPQPLEMERVYHYSHQKEDLVKAILTVMQRNNHKLPPPMAVFHGIVGREPYPVEQKSAEILRKLVEFGSVRFQGLFQSDQSRSEIVATFLAVLELCKARKIRLVGTEEDCTITYTASDEVQISE